MHCSGSSAHLGAYGKRRFYLIENLLTKLSAESMAKQPKEVYTSGDYLENNPSWHVEDSPWKAKKILRMLKRHDLYPENVAEVGCGAGEILSQLAASFPSSVDFVGYEISPQAYELAKPREQERLKFKLADITKEDVFFDLLLVIDVFEHIEDYLGFLRALKPRARHFLFHIPLDLSAQTVLRRSSLIGTRDAVGHLHYFTEDTAIATLRDTGYTVEDYFFTARGVELRGGI